MLEIYYIPLNHSFTMTGLILVIQRFIRIIDHEVTIILFFLAKDIWSKRWSNPKRDSEFNLSGGWTQAENRLWFRNQLKSLQQPFSCVLFKKMTRSLPRNHPLVKLIYCGLLELLNNNFLFKHFFKGKYWDWIFFFQIIKYIYKRSAHVRNPKLCYENTRGKSIPSVLMVDI